MPSARFGTPLALPTGLDAFAEWSVSIVDLGVGDSPRTLAEHDADLLLSSASVGKVFVLIELAERLAAGTLDADLLLDRRVTSRITDSGLWHRLHVDQLPLLDVVTLVGAVSDNWATNVLIDLLGLERIRETARRWAPGGSDLVDVVRGLRGPQDPPHLSLGCARDWTSILARLWADDRAGGAVGRLVLGALTPGVDLSMVASAFDLDPLAHDEDPAGPQLINKTGTNLGVRCDIGIIEDEAHPIAYAVLANWPEEPAGRGRADVLAGMRAIGQQMRSLVETGR